MRESEYVALFKDHEYILGYFSTNGTFIREEDDTLDKLPTVYKCDGITNELLDSIPDVGYVENMYGYTIWDRTVNQYTKLTVPVYVRVFSEYRLTNKTYTFEIVSDEMIQAAKKMSSKVTVEYENSVRNLSIDILKKKLDEGDGIAFISMCDIPSYNMEQLIINSNSRMCILWNDDLYPKYVIGDISKIKSSYLDLYVPRKYVRKIIGKGGCNVKDMSKILEVKKIHVLPLEEKPED